MSTSRNRKSKSSKLHKPSKSSKSSKSTTKNGKRSSTQINKKSNPKSKSKPSSNPKSKKPKSKPSSNPKSKKPKSKSKSQQNNTNTKQDNIWGVKLKKNKKNVQTKTKYKVGDFVLLNNDREGIIGYKGSLHDNPKNMIFYGIELLNGSIGYSDGTHKGKRYFQTLPDRSIFITVDEIRRTMVGKDYNTPRRLDRRQSLKLINVHKRNSSTSKKKQSEFELAIFDVAQEIEAKCDKMDDIKEDSPENIPNVKVTNKAQSKQVNESKDLTPDNATKKSGRKRGRKKGKAKSLALSEIRKKYEQNAKNIDNERQKLVDQMKKRKSFNKVKLDGNVKSAAISGFKKKLKKQNQKEKMKEMFKNENEAVSNSKSIVEDLGFLGYLKDYETYSHLFKAKISPKKKGRRRRKKGGDKPPDLAHKKSVSSIQTLRRDVEKKQKETAVDAHKTVDDSNDANETINKSKANINPKTVTKSNVGLKFGGLNIDPSKLKVGAVGAKRVIKDGMSRDIDHSVLLNKVTVIGRGRKKKTRRQIAFDDDDGVIVKRDVKVNKSVDLKKKNEFKTEEKVNENEFIDEKEEENGKKRVIRFVEEENKINNEIRVEYDVFDMTNSNNMLLLSESNAEILQNVICAAIGSIDTLQVIEMSNCGMDDEFLDKVCESLINDMNGIWCLNFQSNPINDDGMLSLCKLIKANHKCLTHIKLQNNRKDISTVVCEEMCNSLQVNQYIKVFEFEFRHYQYRDKCKKVLWRNNEAARKLRAKKKGK